MPITHAPPARPAPARLGAAAGALGAAAGALGAAVLLVGACGPGSTTGSFTWERMDPSPADGSGPHRIVTIGDRLLGFGATVWQSAGGTDWSPVDYWASAAVGAAPSAVVVLDEGIVAVGLLDGRPTAWHSADGLAWEAVDAPSLGPTPGVPHGELTHLAAGPRGVVAAGTGWGGERQDTLTWWSPDGRSWRQGESLPGEGARGLVATADGFVLAEAAAPSGGTLTGTAFWTSRDGLTWEPADTLASFGNAEPQALVAGSTGLVAVGYRVTERGLAPMAWTSLDGRAWEPADETPAMAWWGVPGPTPVQGEGALQGTSMMGVAAIGDGFLAIGSRWGLDPGLPPDANGQRPISAHGTLWWSADGRSWELLPDAGFGSWSSTSGTLEFGLVSVVAAGDSVFICGKTPELGVTIWRADVPR